MGSTSGLTATKKRSKKTTDKTAIYDGDNDDDDDGDDDNTKSKRKSSEGKSHMTLVIVESPAKARTIQKFVDSDKYIIDFCAGHVRDLPAVGKTTAAYLNQLASKEAEENSAGRGKGKVSADKPGGYFNGIKSLKKVIIEENLKLNIADLGVNVLNDFEPLYMPVEGKEDIISRLKKHSQKCDKILLATDEDREVSKDVLPTCLPNMYNEPLTVTALSSSREKLFRGTCSRSCSPRCPTSARCSTRLRRVRYCRRLKTPGIST